MRIWIDLANSPHVPFFAGMIGRLRDRGHELFITSRPHANTEQLLDLHQIPYTSVGGHWGKRRRAKVAGFAVRCSQLYRRLRHERIDVAISQSSYYQPPVARALGIRCLYLNDNEHAAGNHIAFRFASVVLVPEFLDPVKVAAQGARRDKVVRYPGVKEGLYLWDRQFEYAAPAERPTVFVRPEPWLAQYYSGAVAFLDPVLTDLSRDHDVIVLPRGQAQREHYAKLAGVTVPDGALALEEIVARCHLFLGAGGTMTRELAVLGVPTISTYQDALLDVDRHLIEAGHLVHAPHLTADAARDFLARRTASGPSRELLDKGRAGSELIERVLLGGG